MTLADIPNSIKAAVAIGLLAIGGFTYHDQFITEAEAGQAARIDWIRDLEAEIRMLKRQQKKESPEDAQATQVEIDELKEKLKCVREAEDDKVQLC